MNRFILLIVTYIVWRSFQVAVAQIYLLAVIAKGRIETTIKIDVYPKNQLK